MLRDRCCTGFWHYAAKADLSAKLRRANGEHPEENDDQLGDSRESQAEPARRKDVQRE